MKTSNNLSDSNSIYLTAFMMAFFFIFTSCQKENIVVSSSGNIKTISLQKHAASGKKDQSQDLFFQLLKIDHSGAGTYLPDYSVTVRSDGHVTFIGRKYVGYIGKKEFDLTDEKYFELTSLLNERGFYHITDNLQLNDDVNIPVNATTYRASLSANELTLIDFNKGYPADLIQLRMQAEWILDLSYYIYY